MPAVGFGIVEERMRAMAKRTANLAPVLKVVGEEIVARTRAAFNATTSQTGEVWPKLADSTLHARWGRMNPRLRSKFSDINPKKRSKKRALV